MIFLKDLKPLEPSSFCDPILTFDIDWAHDEVINDVRILVGQYNSRATWMVTHRSDSIDDLKKDSKYDLGIHPNFNDLLSGSRTGSAEEIVDHLLTYVENCEVVRSHSICQSSRLSNLFFSRRIRVESNDYLPASQLENIKPWFLDSGIIKAPYFFSDELACISRKASLSVSSLCQKSGLKIFNFHPIHVFLNTESLDRYERTRPFHQNPKELIKHRYEGYGTRSRLIELLERYK